jgi:hypothetical protein
LITGIQDFNVEKQEIFKLVSSLSSYFREGYYTMHSDAVTMSVYRLTMFADSVTSLIRLPK